MNSKCDLYSCQYNNDGRCGYKEATIKNPNVCACNACDRDFEDNNLAKEDDNYNGN